MRVQQVAPSAICCKFFKVLKNVVQGGKLFEQQLETGRHDVCVLYLLFVYFKPFFRAICFGKKFDTHKVSPI